MHDRSICERDVSIGSRQGGYDVFCYFYSVKNSLRLCCIALLGISASVGRRSVSGTYSLNLNGYSRAFRQLDMSTL